MNSIAVINTCNWGSTGKIGRGLVDYLSEQKLKVFFCYGRSQNKYKHKGDYIVDNRIEFLMHAFMSRLFGNQGSYSLFATLRLIAYLKKNKVDTIYGISLHGYYLNEKLFFKYLKLNHIRFIYIMIDEYAYRGKCGASINCQKYRKGCGNCPELCNYPKSWFFDKSKEILKRKELSYLGVERMAFVGPPFTIDRFKQSPFYPKVKTIELNEAIDTKTFSPQNTHLLEEEFGIRKDKIIILCVAPFSNPMKGGHYFVALARRFEHNPSYSFVYVAYDSDDYKGIPQNMVTYGYEMDPIRLASFYSEADLLVFPSLADTMPNTCLEALSCGTPILCFDISGMPYIVRDDTGYLVEPGDVNAMERILSNVGKKNESMINTCRKYALSEFDNNEYNKKLKEIAEQL